MNKKDLKKYFKKAGITKEYFSNLSGTEIDEFEVEPVKKGSLLRAELYEFTIKPKTGEKFKIFAKNFWPGKDVSGEKERSEILDQNEVKFLQFGKENKLFTPEYYDHVQHEDRTILFMEEKDMSLEEKLIHIHEEIKESKKEKKVELENTAFEYLKRAIDVVLVNNHVATEKYESSDPFKGSTIYEYDQSEFKRYLNNFIFELLDFNFSEDSDSRSAKKDFFAWSLNNNITNVMKELYKNIAEPLGSNLEKRGIVNYDPNPGNILLDQDKFLDYDPDFILNLRNGKISDKKIKIYDGIVVTDNNKIGKGSEAMIAILINHPSVFRLFDNEKMKKLKEHAFVQHYKLQTGKTEDLNQIDSNLRKRFDNEYAAAARFSCLRNIKFVVSLYNNPEAKEKLDGLIRRNELYNPKDFINMNLDYFCNIQDHLSEYLSRINETLNSLNPK